MNGMVIVRFNYKLLIFRMTKPESTAPVKFFYAFVFITGAAVMMLEFAASRVMAPWFGTSTFVWGNIVGVILIALSLGYYIGGRVADKKPYADSLAMIVLAAGVFTSLLPLVIKSLSKTFPLLFIVDGWGILASVFGSFLTVLLLFALPIFLLGMVSPYVIRLATKTVEDAGRVAGGLYAWSTVGSIFGTFASAFFLVPFIGSRETILLSAVLLIIMAAVLFQKRWWAYALVALPILVYMFIAGQPLRAEAAVLYEEESMYNYIKVVDSDDRIKLIVNEGLGVQSYYMKTGVLTGEYYDYLALTPFLHNRPADAKVLVLGLAGGSLTRELDYYFPEYQLTGVEIDPAIVAAAQTYFALDEQDVTVEIDDARRFLQSSHEQYDVIVVDAYANEMYIPWHLTTQEFFNIVDDHLTASGIVTFNVGSINPDTELLQSLITTLRSVFAEVALVPVSTTYNYVVVASNSPMDIAQLKTITDERAGLAKIFSTGFKKMDSSQGIVLTDNRAPIELYTEQMVLDYIRQVF